MCLLIGIALPGHLEGSHGFSWGQPPAQSSTCREISGNDGDLLLAAALRREVPWTGTGTSPAGETASI